MLIDEKVRDFINKLASDLPAPGGGGVAALTGALAAGLISMVCHLTIGRDGYENVEQEMQKALLQSDQLHEKLTNLIDEDGNAFSGVIAAFKMPKELPEDKEKRAQAIQVGYKQAIDVPFAIAMTSLEVLELAKKLVLKANTTAVSDIGVAVLNAYAAIEGAVMSININLASIKDENYVLEKKEQIKNLLDEGEKLKTYIYQEVNRILTK
ncbi:MAG TPA: cyclodeaminase/cyclohydrolase family protein [Syntrophomonadaceae bacterium]|nr:cyclodeaminase/cyclohydrolase family protein [Syntrophomonadaceae bacterium]